MIGTNGLNGATAFLMTFKAMGVEKIFASPGSERAPVWEALANPAVDDTPLYMGKLDASIYNGNGFYCPHRINEPFMTARRNDHQTPTF